MSLGLNDRLNQIRDMQGKERIDPTVIQGEAGPPPAFPPGFGEARQYPPDSEAAYFEDDAEPQYADPQNIPASPLVPPSVARAPRMTQAEQTAVHVANHPPFQTPAPAIDPEAFELSVVWLKGGQAVGVHRGREVVLSEGERAAVARIVLRAVAREVSEALAEVGGATPRRKGGEPARRVRRKTVLKP